GVLTFLAAARLHRGWPPALANLVEGADRRLHPAPAAGGGGGGACAGGAGGRADGGDTEDQRDEPGENPHTPQPWRGRPASRRPSGTNTGRFGSMERAWSRTTWSAE